MDRPNDEFERIALPLLSFPRKLLEDQVLVGSTSRPRVWYEYVGYEGLMARPPATGKNAGKVVSSHQGLFDLKVEQERLGGPMTHGGLIEALLVSTDYERCLEVWRGAQLASSLPEKELELLHILRLAFLEQEVNWGKESWQRRSNFNPAVRNPGRRRPRDMLMGFVKKAYRDGLESLEPYRMRRKPGTFFFGVRGYDSTPEDFRTDFFECWGTDGPPALMTGGLLELFREKADASPPNPRYAAGN
jgi:hypothetical protein